MRLPIRIEVDPLHHRRPAITRWDREASLLGSALPAEPDETSGETPALEAMNRRLGIRAKSYRVVVDRAEFMLDPQHRISSFEVRTNPQRWGSASLSPPSMSDEESAAARMMVDFGDGDMLSFPAVLGFRHDPARLELAVTLGDRRASRWVRLGEGFDIGLTRDGYLCELRLATAGLALPNVR